SSIAAQRGYPSLCLSATARITACMNYKIIQKVDIYTENTIVARSMCGMGMFNAPGWRVNYPRLLLFSIGDVVCAP
ncbi:MAG: hypothetical protein VZT48_02610, partial [Bulleidia sp.]|nr:hypothetical protein [Bulleidia sp.]